MIADHPQHMLFIALIATKSPQLSSNFRAGRIGHTRHNSRKRATQRPPFYAVISIAQIHEQTTNIGEAKAESAELIAAFGDLF